MPSEMAMGLGFADGRLEVRGPTKVIERLRFLYRDFEQGVFGPGLLERGPLTGRFAVDRANGELVIREESASSDIAACESVSDAVWWMDWCVASHFLGDDPGDLTVLHAAAVQITPDASLLVSGPSGAGKSSLCAALLGLGAEFLSDEYVPIDARSLRPIAYPRALGLKRLPSTRAGMDAVFREPEGEQVWLRPERRSSPGRVAPPLRAVVFARHGSTPEMELTPVGKARSFALLLAQAPMLSEHEATFDTLAELADSVPAFELRYADAERAARRLLERLG